MTPNPAHHAASPQARHFALIPAAGVGQRAGTALPKQYAEVAGQTVLERTLCTFSSLPEVSATLVVLAPEDASFDSRLPDRLGGVVWVARCGGATRAETVLAGLHDLLSRGALPDDWVLVHDAARCLVRPEWVQRLLAECANDDVGGLLAVPVADTLKSARDGRSMATVDRSDKWVAQTPQMFRIGMLLDALVAAGSAVTDEASAIEAAGHRPLLVRGDARNFKITWPQDFEMAEAWLRTVEVDASTAVRPKEGGGTAR